MRDININQAPVDRFTLAHFAVGAAYQKAGVPLPVAFFFSLLFEFVLEPKLKRINPEVFPFPSQDTFANSVCDVIALVAGWESAQAYL